MVVGADGVRSNARKLVLVSFRVSAPSKFSPLTKITPGIRRPPEAVRIRYLSVLLDKGSTGGCSDFQPTGLGLTRSLAASPTTL